MDKITQSFIDDFKESYGLTDKPEDYVFNLFTEYCIVSNYFSSESVPPTLMDAINVEDYDAKIGGVAVMVNGKLVSSTQEVDDLLSANDYLEVRFIFIHIQYSDTIDATLMSEFGNNVEMLFKSIVDKVELPRMNQQTMAYYHLLLHIYGKSVKFRGEPKLMGFVASKSLFTPDALTPKFVIDKTNSLRAYNLVCDVQSQLLGRKELVDFYKHSKIKEEAEITVEDKRFTLPPIPNVREGHLMLLPFSEFRKLIIDEKTDTIKNVFNDNIRAYQGTNVVNRSIAETLRNNDFALFTAMNNGITVITRSLETVGATFKLSDYQIVNGCQTSHVLYQNRNIPGIDKVQLLVKLISSTDKNVRNNIIMGANSQTEVKREQLIALSDLQERIEDYYNSVKKFERLYYERRSKQYRNEVKVPQYKVITIPIQIMSFVSMFLSEPHNVRGYYGSIVETLERDNKKVFSESYQIDCYYTCGLTYFRLSRLFESGFIPTKYKKVKFHLMLAFRLVAEEKHIRMPELSDKRMGGYCEDIIVILNSPALYEPAFKKALFLIDKALGRDPEDKDRFSSKFTTTLFNLSYSNQTNYEATIKASDMLNNLRVQLETNLGKKQEGLFYINGTEQEKLALTSILDKSSHEINVFLASVANTMLNEKTVIDSLNSYFDRGGNMNVLVRYGQFADIKQSQFFTRLLLMQIKGKNVLVKECGYKHFCGNYVIFDSFGVLEKPYEEHNGGTEEETGIVSIYREKTNRFLSLFKGDFNSASREIRLKTIFGIK